MNRHERRAQQSVDRKNRRKRGSTVPEEGRTLPPEYYALVERMAQLMFEWIKAEPVEPNLKWLEPDSNGVIITGNLATAARFLADSPDAFRLLEWVDMLTGGEATLYQATWALRLIRQLPMPDGSYYGVETKYESGAFHMLRSVLDDAKQRQVAGSPCTNCGKFVDCVSHPDGNLPKPGDVSVCLACGGYNRFGDDLKLEPLDIDALPDELRARIEDMQAILRSRMSGARHSRVDA